MFLRLRQRNWDTGSQLHRVAVRVAVNQQECWVSVFCSFFFFLLHSNKNKSSEGVKTK